MPSPLYQVTDPSTGKVVETYPTAGDQEIQEVLTASDQAYDAWKDVPMPERAVILKRVGQLFRERSADLAELAHLEMGKSIGEATWEAKFCQRIFDYFADNGPALAADQPITTFSGGKAVVQKLPIGPLLGIMPWNFPFYQVARFAAPNLMLGNTVVVKHAESVPGSALALEKILQDAGAPAGVYLNVFASHEQIETIIGDPRVQGVSLTGSERAGAIIASIAGRNLKKCVLELGGSDPFVVLDAADLDSVVDTAWKYRMSNVGQACNSNKRMIVMEDLYDRFVEKLTERAQAMVPGSYAPMSSRGAAESLAAQVQDAVSKGGTLHAGGVISDGPDAFFSPAVLTGVTKEMRAYSEELFGPVAVVYRVASDEEALRLANDSVYGLGGSVWSDDAERATKVAQKLESGMTNVNLPSGVGADLPFGGVKRSGYGRELGPLGMDEFVNKRLFLIAD